MKFLDPLQEPAYALLRIMSGLLFLAHGTQKLLGFPTSLGQASLSPLLYTAGGIELVGGALIAIGLFTRPAAFVCSGMAAAAYWMVHGFKSFYPIANGGELAVLYCFIFLFVATRGAGIWSVDKLRS